jgi:diaminohydroxyphosphoribosylaminopyrimidine deaminase/5-amino-6-(5-phosphoribosylamino)uracil reductase
MGDIDARDAHHIARCIELARRAEGRTAPNPMVGCVICGPDGAVLAEGWHRGPGSPHAEIDALAKLGGRAPGATVYANLEPCHHVRGRRNPPCSRALAEAQIARLVIGIGDPIRGHAGGARFLARAHGVAVTRGVLRDACRRLNRGFITWARRGRPHITLKAAISLDGRIATGTGESQWITGPQARLDAHRLRDRADAVMVGIGTALADDPRLTVRGVRGGRDPIRVVVDSRLRTPPRARLLPANSASSARVVIATTRRASESRKRRLEAAGAEVWSLPSAENRVSLAALGDVLGDAGITRVLVEGGGALHAGLLATDLADELVLYVAPIVLGGRGVQAGPTWVSGQGVRALADAPRFRFDTARKVGQDLVLRARRR